MARRRTILDPGSRSEALPSLTRRYGSPNGHRCINCGAALYGHFLVFCPRVPGLKYDCRSEYDPALRSRAWWKDQPAV